VKTDSYKWGVDSKETAWLQAGNPLRKSKAGVPPPRPRRRRRKTAAPSLARGRSAAASSVSETLQQAPAADHSASQTRHRAALVPITAMS
jgi:hypothetical protein